MKRNRRYFPGMRRARGFSLLEVLIALVVLAVGLLGFALLQTMSLRFAQSANHRTQATNLAYDLLDQMRANRYQQAWYTGAAGASFQPGTIPVASCQAAARQPVGTVTIAASVRRWQCQTIRTLGSSAGANVRYLGDGRVAVSVFWGDERWNPGGWDTTNTAVQDSFEVVTRL